MEAKGEAREEIYQDFFLGASQGAIPEMCFRNVVCCQWCLALRECC